MPINWFPGHMATARAEIRKRMPEVDLVLEVLDARIPVSSANPLVAELRGTKPCIQLLNKADLADPEVTAAWLERLPAVAHQHQAPHLARALSQLAARLVPEVRARPRIALVVGIPNVGKSTVINTLAGRAVAKVGNKPAITQMQQRVKVSPELEILDTPGFLWPKLSPAERGYHLAMTGAISDRVLDLVEIATWSARRVIELYPGALGRFYGVVEGDTIVEAIGRRRGLLQKGGVVDLQKAAERVLFDLRAGSFGRLSFERP